MPLFSNGENILMHDFFFCSTFSFIVWRNLKSSIKSNSSCLFYCLFLTYFSVSESKSFSELSLPTLLLLTLVHSNALCFMRAISLSVFLNMELDFLFFLLIFCHKFLLIGLSKIYILYSFRLSFLYSKLFIFFICQLK